MVNRNHQSVVSPDEIIAPWRQAGEPHTFVAAREAFEQKHHKKTMTPATSLRAVKLIHTIIWAFFAGCIIAIPILCLLKQTRVAALLVGIVFIEVLVLAVNRLRCPLTDVAAKYTGDRQDNFDIYLPLWLARHNKLIFGLLYLAGMLLTLAGWQGWLN